MQRDAVQSLVEDRLGLKLALPPLPLGLSRRRNAFTVAIKTGGSTGCVR